MPDPDDLAVAERMLFERYGLTVETRVITLTEPGVRTRVLLAGDGPPVVLLHGGGGTSALWAPFMAELSGMSIFAIDRPGCGINDFFDYRGVDVRHHAVSFLGSALEALSLERVPIVANSIGGLWGFWLAVDRPHHVSSLMQLGCPALMFGTHGPLTMRFRDMEHRGRFAEAAGAIRTVFRLEAGERALESVPPEVLLCMYEAELRPAHLRTRMSMLKEMVRLRACQPDMGLGDEQLSRVTQPVLFGWGTEDAYGSIDDAFRAANILPNCTVVPFLAGHFPWLDEPAGCAHAVRSFLQPQLKPSPLPAGLLE